LLSRLQEQLYMKPNFTKRDSHKTMTASNAFSIITGTAAACCSGPGIVACSTSCAPSCGSLLFSVFGFSSSALTNWLTQYWYIFLFCSIVSFSFAFYKLFLKPNCKVSRTSKMVFISCFTFSMILIAKSFFSC